MTIRSQLDNPLPDQSPINSNFPERMSWSYKSYYPLVMKQHNCEVPANQGVGLIKTLGSWREAETRYYMAFVVKKLQKPGLTPSEIARDAPYP